MINEEKVRERIRDVQKQAVEESRLGMTAVCRSSPQAITDGTIYGKRA